jgi:hypothetical protein
LKKPLSRKQTLRRWYWIDAVFRRVWGFAGTDLVTVRGFGVAAMSDGGGFVRVMESKE